MAVLYCKMCGGDLSVLPGDPVAKCKFCGCVQTVPSPDNDKKLNLFARANKLRLNCEFDKAAGVYETIAAEYPREPEAYWGSLLCRYGIAYVDDPLTGSKIPTCHRATYQCVLDDGDLELALENADAAAKRIYREEAKQIERLRRNVVEVSSAEEPYDIFICYKDKNAQGERTQDSVLAQDLYDALSSKGYRVFFSRISLEDKPGCEYEPYIFSALQSAKVMLAVGTDYEHFHAVWVKNEWSRFLKLMTEDTTKHLIPCFRNMDIDDLPREFAKLQAVDMGKIGATQDLLRGIEKLLKGVAAQESAAHGVNLELLLARSNEALAKKAWAVAHSGFDQVLLLQSYNAQAYLGKLLAKYKCPNLQALGKRSKLIRLDRWFRLAYRYADAALKRQLDIASKEAGRRFAVKTIAISAAVVAGFVLSMELGTRIIVNSFRNGSLDARSGYFALKCVDWYRDQEGDLYLAALGMEDAEKAAQHAPKALTLSQTTIAYMQDRVSLEGYRAVPVEKVTVLDGVTAIPDQAFYAFERLERVSLSNSVTQIGDSAFKNCGSLVSIALPENLASIGPYAFYGCKSLKSICIPKKVTNIGKLCFANCEGLTEVLLPSGLVSISEHCFYQCRNLTTIQLPAQLCDIGNSAFARCTSLSDIAFPDGLHTIGASAFEDCSRLEMVELPDSITMLSDRTFSGCSFLYVVTFPKSLTILGKQCFYGCSNLRKIDLPDSLSMIGSNVFQNCAQLRQIVIPLSVKNIGTNAFMGCESLEWIGCEAAQKPEQWHLLWAANVDADVIWNYTP